MAVRPLQTLRSPLQVDVLLTWLFRIVLLSCVFHIMHSIDMKPAVPAEPLAAANAGKQQQQLQAAAALPQPASNPVAIPVAQSQTTPRKITPKKLRWDCLPPCEMNDAFFNSNPELQIKDIFKHAISTSTENPPQVLDIGMNAGYFTLWGSALGAEVTSFEPQPACIKYFNDILKHPDNAPLASNVHVFNVGVGERGSINTAGKCEGRFQGGGTEATIPLVPMSSLWTLPRPVAIAKVDTEGAEIPVLEGLLPLVKAGLLHNIVVEVSPKWWPNRGTTKERGLAALQALEAASRNTYLLWDHFPFTFKVAKAPLPNITPPMYQNFSMAEMVHERLTTSAENMNLWFNIK